MHLPNFDRIAFVYDTLKHLVFGKSLRQAQAFLIPYIPADANLLIVGGGTGQVLLDILKVTKVRTITYVELSENMLNAAKAKAESYPNINFVLGSAHQLNTDQSYDVILTPFVLDIYSEEVLPVFLKALDRLLLSEGIWMVSDFKVAEAFGWKMLWQNALVKSMYAFFSLVSNLKIFRLPDYDKAFRQLGYKLVIHRSFYGGLVHSQILLKAKAARSKP